MLILNANLITWGEPNQILKNQALYISDGKIADIGATDELLIRYPDEPRLDARDQYVMPGNINTHGHFYGAFARGLAIPGEQPFNLPTILQKLWWPFDKAMREQDVRYSALVGLVDAIKHGTTTLMDHQSSPNFIDGALDVIAEAVEQAGLRAVLCFEVTDRDGEARAIAGIQENVRFINRCGESGLADGCIRGIFGMHACMTIGEQTLSKCREAAPEGTGFHIHVAEHEYDEYRSLQMAGTRSVDRLHQHNLINDRSIMAHAVHLDAREVALVAESAASISHQPRSNMNTGTGIAEVESYLRAGVNVCVGNDGLSNTMWKEWEFAYLAPKVKHRDARRMPGDHVIQMGVYNNATLASRYFTEGYIGVIKPDAYADLIFVDYNPTTPLTVDNLPWHILFGFEESMITTTLVNGEVLMRDRELLTLDEEEITAKSSESVPAFWERYRQLVPDDAILG